VLFQRIRASMVVTASATTDMGHQGGFDGSWAANNPQAQIDFSYRRPAGV